MTMAALAFVRMDECSQMILEVGHTPESAKQAASRLCEVAGLWDMLAHVFVVQGGSDDSREAKSRPLELLGPDMLKGFAAASMAQAAEIGALAAVAKQTKHSLVAKLFIDAHEKYVEAKRLFGSATRYDAMVFPA